MMPGKTLAEIFSEVPVEETRGDMRRVVQGLAYDSRDVQPGFLFAALDGLHTDGHRWVADALKRGAAAVLHSRPLDGVPAEVTCVRVREARTALSPVAAAFHGHPSRQIKVVGVTGTDGKSSTVWFISQLLGLAGRKAGFLSTVSFKTGDQVVKNPFRQSTPEATEVQGMLRDMLDQGREFAVVEATSHGLSRRTNRLGDVMFDAAVLTNVTHEHLEFHGSFEQYRSDKANLFRALSAEAEKSVRCPRFGVVNAADPSASYFEQASRVPVYRYGSSDGLWARDARGDISGTTFRMAEGSGEAEARICIPGPFWVENSLAAVLAVARVLEVSPITLAPLVSRLKSVPGRMDYVSLGQPFAVIVDYAHTVGAFLKLFPWARANTAGRLTAVFGSAGERDREKRPLQGRAAAAHCDTVVITDEDPRGDDRLGILEDIAAGCEGKTRGVDLFLVPDRRDAIRLAFTRAGPGDSVLLLGKGHEASIIGPRGPAEWDERAEAEAALRALGYGG
jgi:UDP-N-acetylmuramoyl-L-alanyl-D-glutamate--2,6-diaminopimelate ligase